MCGIVAYCGSKQNGPELVLNGLKKLEYRGYDSWGIATKNEDKIRVYKKTGRINSIQNDEIVKLLNCSGCSSPQPSPHRGEGVLKTPSPRFIGERAGVRGNNLTIKQFSNCSSICIGHTRWATHGGVSDANAHPHTSCDGKIAVVHNGIIENYQELRHELEKDGHKFKSQTDTEVIAHLIEKHSKKMDFVAAVRKTLRQVEGNYAIAVINLSDQRLVGARQGSPLVLGLGGGEYFLSSDVPAFIDQTKKVVYLDEAEMVVIDGSKWSLLSVATGEEIKRRSKTVNWNAEEAEKGGFDHFLIKEINEQPKVITNSATITEKELTKAVSMMKKARNIYLVACGTAMHAGMAGQYLFSQICARSTHLISAAEFPYFENLLTSKDLVITISQSGETADVLAAVRSAQARQSKVLALVNVMGSSLMRLANYSILTKAGPEICVLSTKAYSSQLATLILLAYGFNGELEQGRKLLKNASQLVTKILDTANFKAIKTLAKIIAKSSDLYVIGRGINYPTALEAALKIKEVSYIHAEGFAGGDLKHGPIALIDKGIPCLAFVASDESEKEILSNAMEIKARGGFIIGVGPKNNEIFDVFLPVPDSAQISPLLNIVPAQILAYYLAIERNCDPDKPRNLAKSVTVK